MNSKEYWEQRAILKDKLLEKDISKVEKELLKLFKNSKKEVLNELKIIYSDIESTEYQKYRIDSLLTSINNSLDNLYSKSEKEITEGLKEIYKTMYQEANVDLKASFNTINENLIEEVARSNLGSKLNESRDIFALHNEVLEKIVDDLIASNWSGLTLIERILEHKRKLSLTLKEELSKGLIRGDSLQDISRILSKKMDLSYSNALRIVRTEGCWVMNEATVNNYKDNGIKEYEFMAFLVKKTSQQCRELDGERCYIDEARAGLNLPPLHPNCRSCIIPITEKVVIDKPKEKEVNTNKIPNNKEGIIKYIENEIGITVNKVDEVDKVFLKASAEFLTDFTEKYPKIKDHELFKKINITSEKLGWWADTDATTMQMRLSTVWYKNYDKHLKQYYEDVKSGYAVASDEDKVAMSTFAHEFGHLINFIITHDVSGYTINYDMIAKEYRDDTLKAYRKETKEKGIKISSIGRLVSRYGQTSSEETFAEAFCEYYTNSNPRTFAKLFGEKLEKDLEKYK